MDKLIEENQYSQATMDGLVSRLQLLRDCRYRLTDHAIERFRVRVPGCSDRPLSAMLKMLRQAKPAEIDPVTRVTRIINNGFKEAEYLECSGVVFVVVDGTIVSCETKAMWRADR